MNLQKGLVGHWTMDDADTSDGTLYDRSAYDNHGTLDSGINTGVSGKIDEAYSFTGETLSIPAIEPDTITISSWVNPDNDTDDMRWGRLDYSSSNNRGILLRYNSGNFQLLHGDGTTIVYTPYVSVSNISGTWIHTVCTVTSNGDTEFWINGVLEDTNTSNGLNWGSSGGTFEISETGRFTGQIDDFRIYNRTLSEDEINALYQMRSPRRQTNELDKGLVGHWTMDDADTSGGMLYDSSAYGNHATLNGDIVTGVSGKVGGAYTLDESNDYLTITNSSELENPDSFTLSTWINPNTVSGDNLVAGKDQSYKLYLSNGTLDLYDGNASSFAIRGNETISTNNWTHIVYTYDSSELVGYINGVQDTITSYTANFGTGGKIAIGADPSSVSNQLFGGEIDDVMIYNRALSESEINRIYNKRLHSAIPSSVVAQNNLFAYWGISEGSGQEISEPVNNNIGTINNATWESSSTWHERQAIVGNGNDSYVSTTSLGSFGSQLTDDFAVGLTYRIDGDLSNNQYMLGVNNPTQNFRMFANDYWGILFEVIDNNGNQIQHTPRGASNYTPTVGERERLIINKVSNTGDDWEMYINGSEIGTNNQGSDADIVSTIDFENIFYYLALNDQGSLVAPLNGALDNISIWTDSLTNTEITEDYNNQPWS
jgi:hypothetical protein